MRCSFSGSRSFRFYESGSKIPLLKPTVPDVELETLSCCSAAVNRNTCNLQASRVVKSDEGLFLTLVPTKDAELRQNSMSWQAGSQRPILPWPRQISAPTVKLLKKWISFSDAVTSELDTTFVFGNWLEFAACRLFNSTTLCAAVECFLISTTTFVNPTAENLLNSHKCNSKAVKCIRIAIEEKDFSLSTGADICMAISLMRYVEVST
jgi:hypothetical protein